MKHIKQKHIVVFSLLMLAMGSVSAASVGGTVGSPSKLQKNNSELSGSDYKTKRDYDRKLFLEKQKNKQRLVGFDTSSLSDFFKKLKEENKK